MNNIPSSNLSSMHHRAFSNTQPQHTQLDSFNYPVQLHARRQQTLVGYALKPLSPPGSYLRDSVDPAGFIQPYLPIRLQLTLIPISPFSECVSFFYNFPRENWKELIKEIPGRTFYGKLSWKEAETCSLCSYQGRIQKKKFIETFTYPQPKAAWVQKVVSFTSLTSLSSHLLYQWG